MIPPARLSPDRANLRATPPWRRPSTTTMGGSSGASPAARTGRARPMPDLRALPRAAESASPAAPAGAASRLLSAVGATAFRLASRVRGERAIHTRGTAVAASFVVRGGSTGVPLLDEPGRHDAVVRFSRAVGLPDRLPDILGIAIRVLDAHGPGRPQDLLLDSTLDLPLLRRVPLPRYDLLGVPYTSVTAYELAGRRRLLAVLPDPGAPRTASLRELAGRGDGARLRLAAATGRGWQTLAVVELQGPVAHARSIRFSPDRTGGGIRPVGWLQDLRKDAYRATHVGPDA